MLEVETRGLKGPRTLDASGLPLHPDNGTIIKERIFLDAANRNRLHDQITTIDHAYSRPWTVTRDYNRQATPHWVETNCDAENHYLMLGKETYFISVDGYLMPTKKNQTAPALGKFEPSSPSEPTTPTARAAWPGGWPGRRADRRARDGADSGPSSRL